VTTLAGLFQNAQMKKKKMLKKKKRINELKDLSFAWTSSPNGNIFFSRRGGVELQVEIFFLIIGHP